MHPKNILKDLVSFCVLSVVVYSSLITLGMIAYYMITAERLDHPLSAFFLMMPAIWSCVSIFSSLKSEKKPDEVQNNK